VHMCVCQVKSTLFMWHISYSRQQPQCAPHKPCVGAGLSYCTLGALCVCVGVCVVVHMLCQPSRCEGIKGARRPPPRCHLLLLGERGNKTRRHTHTHSTHTVHTHINPLFLRRESRPSRSLCPARLAVDRARLERGGTAALLCGARQVIMWARIVECSQRLRRARVCSCVLSAA
jgi:hypothetical protein